MQDFSSTRLNISFTSQFEPRPNSYYGDSSSIIPASTLGRVVSSTNNLMLATWDYAITNTNDERFDDIRRLESKKEFSRQDIGLVIVAFGKGSLSVALDWAAVAGAAYTSVAAAMAPNALWDLTKYCFQSFLSLIRTDSEGKKQNPVDPLTNQLLPTFAEVARHAYSSFGNKSSVKTNLSYRDPDSEININIDQHSQPLVLEANPINTQFTTRLVGQIVAVDFAEGTIGIRLEQFPGQTIWTDIEGFNIHELNEFLPRFAGEEPKRIGFDAEVGWRRGAANILPPEIMRIIQIVPENELLNPNFSGHSGLSRPPLLSLGLENK